MQPKVTLRKIADLVAHESNARSHSEEQVEQIAGSIKEFGFNQPVLVRGDTIISGHGRVEAMELLGETEIPTIAVDHLTEEQAKALLLADNKIAINAGWDYRILKNEFEALDEAGFEYTLTGFSDDDLYDLRGYPEDVELANVEQQFDNSVDQMRQSTETEVRQVVLVLDDEEYDFASGRFEALQDEMDVYTNADVVLRLLAERSKAE